MFCALMGGFTLGSVPLVAFQGKTRLCNTTLLFPTAVLQVQHFAWYRVGTRERDEDIAGQAKGLGRGMVGALARETPGPGWRGAGWSRHQRGWSPPWEQTHPPTCGA